MNRVDPMETPAHQIGAMVLVRDLLGRVLMVKQERATIWTLPGDTVHQGELIAEAAARGLKRGTGLVRPISKYLALDQPDGSSDNGSTELAIVCDGGDLSEEEATAAASPFSAPGIADLEWFGRKELPLYTEDHQCRRIEEALSAAARGWTLPLLQCGQRYSRVSP
jgi:ADP-ribose pyrophosphatase YjhB (NUDIX family)